MKALTFVAGLLHRSKVREFLEQRKFLGAKIEWIEQKQFGQSTFTIKGSDDDMKIIERSFDAYVKLVDENRAKD